MSIDEKTAKAELLKLKRIFKAILPDIDSNNSRVQVQPTGIILKFSPTLHIRYSVAFKNGVFITNSNHNVSSLSLLNIKSNNIQLVFATIMSNMAVNNYYGTGYIGYTKLMVDIVTNYIEPSI